jgi:hypothetical protein
MSNSKSDRRLDFRIVCVNCDALGIVFDCTEDAAPSTLILCRRCGAPRGTLGDLRNHFLMHPGTIYSTSVQVTLTG